MLRPLASIHAFDSSRSVCGGTEIEILGRSFIAETYPVLVLPAAQQGLNPIGP